MKVIHLPDYTFIHAEIPNIYNKMFDGKQMLHKSAVFHCYPILMYTKQPSLISQYNAQVHAFLLQVPIENMKTYQIT